MSTKSVVFKFRTGVGAARLQSFPSTNEGAPMSQTFGMRYWNAKHSSVTLGLKLLENHTFHHLQFTCYSTSIQHH
jgi:hypothetical protein